MQVSIDRVTVEGNYKQFDLSAGKKESIILINVKNGEVNVICNNASHKAGRGCGRYFDSIEDAIQGYKSEAMKSMIETAWDLHTNTVECDEVIVEETYKDKAAKAIKILKEQKETGKTLKEIEIERLIKIKENRMSEVCGYLADELIDEVEYDYEIGKCCDIIARLESDLLSVREDPTTVLMYV